MWNEADFIGEAVVQELLQRCFRTLVLKDGDVVLGHNQVSISGDMGTSSRHGGRGKGSQQMWLGHSKKQAEEVC